MRRPWVALIAGWVGLAVLGCDEKHTAEPADVRLVIFSGNGQVAPISTELPDPLVVQLVGSSTGIAERSIEWTVIQGGGAVTQTLSTTDADGFASTFLTLGPTSGAYGVRATLMETSETVEFAATGEP